VPIDKFSKDNIINRMEFLLRISQVHPWRMVFGDKKPLKGGALFNRRGPADPMTGELEDLVVDSDWRNKYNITGLCRIGRDRPCFSYVIHNGSNNAAAFSDFIFSNLASGFLRAGDFLSWTMRPFIIMRKWWDLMSICGTITVFSFSFFPLALRN